MQTKSPELIISAKDFRVKTIQSQETKKQTNSLVRTKQKRNSQSFTWSSQKEGYIKNMDQINPKTDCYPG